MRDYPFALSIEGTTEHLAVLLIAYGEFRPANDSLAIEHGEFFKDPTMKILESPNSVIGGGWGVGKTFQDESKLLKLDIQLLSDFAPLWWRQR